MGTSVTVMQIVIMLTLSSIDKSCAKSYVLVRINQTVELKCPRQSTTAAMDWFVPGNVPPISKDSVLYWNTDNNRISITGNHSIGQYNLRISDIKTSDLGMYRCTVSIKNVAYQHEFKLYIGKPPKNLKIENSENQGIIQGTEGEELVLQCGVESGFPKEVLLFESNGTILKESNTSVVKFAFVLGHSDHRKQYTCKAVSPALSVPLSQTVTIKLFYSPQVNLSVVGQSIMIEEGKQLTVGCFADSNPEPKNYTWIKMSEHARLITTLSTLYIDAVQRQDAGLYACVVTNIIGSGKAEINVVAMYSPTVQILYTNYTEEAKQRVLVCIAKGVPETYTFFEWEHKSYYGEHIRYMSGNQNGSLNLPNENMKESGYQDNGYYKCTVSNGIADKSGSMRQSTEVYLIVKGKPIFVSDNVGVVYGKHFGSISIEVNIFSIPKYTNFEMFNGNSQLINFKGHFRLIEEHTSVTDRFHGTNTKVIGFKITVKIEWLTTDHFDKYTFKAKNEFGHSIHRISVLSAGLPEQPLNVTIVPVANGALVEWSKNFNGGFTQSFFIEYRHQENDKWQMVQSLNTTMNNRIFWKIGNLQEDQSYSFRMFSRNKIGDSNRTEEIFVTITRKSSMTIFFVVVGSVSLASVLVIAIAIYMMKKCISNQCNTQKTVVQPNTYHLEERVYDEVDEHLMTESCITNPQQNKRSDHKDEHKPIQKDNSNRRRDMLCSLSQSSKYRNQTLENENMRHSYEKLNDPHSYEQLNDK